MQDFISLCFFYVNKGEILLSGCGTSEYLSSFYLFAFSCSYSLNNKDYPIKWEIKQSPTDGAQITRSNNNLVETRHSKHSDSTFMNDAARLWNIAPQKLKECKNIYSVKKEIKKFVGSFPL